MEELQAWLGTIRGICAWDTDCDVISNFKYLPRMYLAGFELRNITYINIVDNSLIVLHPDIVKLTKLTDFYIYTNPILILTQTQADFISSIQYHSDLSNFTIIPDSELAKDLFL